MGKLSFSLEGKVALITGGRRGIGKGIALAFAEAGTDVAVGDLVADDGELEAVAEEIRKMGRRSFVVQADTSRKADVDNMVQKVIAQFGVIDILVNNAGIDIRKSLLEMPEEDWDRLHGVDLKGYYLCAQAVSPGMIARQQGCIINVASTLGIKTAPGRGAYSSAKAGVIMLTRGLAQELGRHGIRANAIAPGLARTEFGRHSWSDPAYLKKMEDSIPLGRIAEVDDIVGAAVFLASGAAAFITGITIPIDGGRTA